MAVDTTVQVVMPAMGDSVSEGTVLEWHKHEGDHVSAEETLVEISTDKVDAEVPAPAGGVAAPGVGAPPSEPPAPGAATAVPDAEREAAAPSIEIVMPQMGESVSE